VYLSTGGQPHDIHQYDIIGAEEHSYTQSVRLILQVADALFSEESGGVKSTSTSYVTFSLKYKIEEPEHILGRSPSGQKKQPELIHADPSLPFIIIFVIDFLRNCT
jgi:hypothetical protein